MNHGFEIKINSEPPIRAGLDLNKYAISCILTVSRPKDRPYEEIGINAGGYDGVSDMHFDWLQRDLRPGDVIQITVIDGDYQPPRLIRPRITAEDVIDQKLKYFFALKEELKEYLQE